MHTVLILGGYGFFGRRIAADLAPQPGIRLLIAGRSLSKARAACVDLGLPDDHAVLLDAAAPELPVLLIQSGAQTLIHTAGPFQAQDYAVARAAISAGCNYIDLADGRQFVGGITELDSKAKAAGVTVISGASSVPGLSSAVVERYRANFARLDSIRTGIASGARAPGIATVLGIFGYCGKAIRRLEAGQWGDSYGWLDLQRYHFASPVGARLLGSCDVPDLDLFPRLYPTVHTVTFHAGFASPMGHLFVWMLSGLVKAGVLRSLVPCAHPLNRLSRWIEPWVSDKGAMFVELQGLGMDGQPLHKRWQLLAAQNHGPHIPCGASIALARKLASGVALPRGAMPCVGLLSVEDYLGTLTALDVREHAP